MTVYFKQEFERIKALYHAVGGTEEREKLVRERKELVETLLEVNSKLWSINLAEAFFYSTPSYARTGRRVFRTLAALN